MFGFRQMWWLVKGRDQCDFCMCLIWLAWSCGAYLSKVKEGTNTVPLQEYKLWISSSKAVTITSEFHLVSHTGGPR